MANVLAPFFRQQFFDNNGRPLAGGKISFFVAGSTSQYKGTFSDYLGAAANTNPVILDSTGTAKIFGSGLYDVMVQDSNNVLIERIEGVNFGGSGGGGEGTSIIVSNYAALRTMGSNYNLVFVEGRETVGDGGQGWFQYINGSSLPDDDGIVLLRGATNRYIRVLDDYIDPRWYGVVYGAALDQRIYLSAALAASASYILPVIVTGTVYLGSKLTILNGQRVTVTGSLVGLSADTEVRFNKGSVVSLAKNSLNNYIKPIFEQSVVDQMYLSWFVNTDDNSRFSKLALSSTYNYKVNIDLDTTITTDISIPSNFVVDVIGGSIITVNAKSKISIPSLEYNGQGQMVRYNNIDYIDTIDFGAAYTNLEWFGGIAGYGFSVDNTIAFKAATIAGKIELVDSYYRVKAISTYNTGKSLSIKGKDNTSDHVLNFDAVVNCSDLTTKDVTLTGAGSISAIGYGDVSNSSILGVSSRAPLTQNAKAGVYISNNYAIAANGGTLKYSTDLVTYSTVSAGTANLTSIIKGAYWFALVEGTGTAYKSADGGQTFTLTTITGRTITKMKYLDGKYFALTLDGHVISSTDGVSWNDHATIVTSPLRDIAKFNSLFVVVGDSAKIQTSGDLSSWTVRPVDNSVTGNLLAVSATTSQVIVSGSLSGVYLRSTSGTSYQLYTMTNSCTVYQIQSNNDTVVMASSVGAWVSADKGLSFALQTFNGVVKAVNYNSGSWLFGSPVGYVYQSTDLKTYNEHYIGAAYDVNDIAVLPPVYAIVGESNSVSVSVDNVTYSPVTVDSSTEHWNNVKTLNGTTYLLGNAGRLFTTIDFTSFRQITTGTTQKLFDIVYNSTSTKITIVGENGYISSTSNINNLPPTWTTLASPTSNTFTKIIWDGTSYTLSDVDNIWQSTDLLTAPTKITYSGLVSRFVTVGTAKVMLGPAGYVAVDSGSGFVKITNFTTANVSASYSTGTLAVVGYDDGSIWTSTNGLAWSQATGTGSTKINRIMYDSVHSNWVYVGNSAAVYISSNATSWSSHLVSLVNYSGSTITYTGDLYGCWLDTNMLNISGTNGFWASEITEGVGNFKTLQGYDLGTSSTIKIVAGYDSVHPNPPGAVWPTPNIHRSYAVGGSVSTGVWVAANGFNTTYTPIPSSYEVSGKIGQIIDYVDGIVLDVDGNLWALDLMHATPAQTFVGDFVADPSITSLCHGGDGYLYAVGDNIWRAASSTNYTYFERVYEIPTGIIDLKKSGSTLYVSGSNGLYATSANGYAWTYAGDSIYTGAIENIDYYQYTSKYLNDTTYLYPSIFLNGYNGLLLVKDKTIYSGSSEYSPVISASYFDLVDVTANVGLVSTGAGRIQNCNILNISHVGDTSDSVFRKLTGIIAGNVVRSTILAGSMITIDKDIIISESSINKTDASDATRAPLFDFTGNILTISFCNIVSNSSLMYSEDTGKKVYINYGSCDVKGMSNGYANVYFAGTGSDQDSTLYSINGLTNQTSKLSTDYGTVNATGALAGWFNLPAGSTTDATSITLGAATYLGRSTKTSNVLVYNPYNGTAHNTMRVMSQYGGRVKMEVTFPTGVTPDSNINLRVSLVHQMFADIFARKLYSQWVDGQSSDLQIAPKTNAKLINYANAWCGVSEPFVLAPATDYRYFDEYYTTADMVPSTKEVRNNMCVVIYNAGSGVIPAGTKIKVELIPEMAKNTEIYHAWYPEFDYVVACKDGSNADQPQHKYSYVSSSKDELRMIASRSPDEGILIITDV